MRVVKERRDRFEVDPDRGLAQVMALVPDGGNLDQKVRRLENTYFGTPGAGLRMFGSRYGVAWGPRDGLAVECPSRDGALSPNCGAAPGQRHCRPHWRRQ